jgi:nicotinamidase-related amidase
VDAYSAFSDNDYIVFTPLAKVLYQRGITEVEVAGLALDYCVKWTAIDSRKFGFTTRLLKKCTKAVDSACEVDVLDSLQGSWEVIVVD